jgi:hypothetical protein
LEPSLHTLLHHRTAELGTFLRDACNLELPTAWEPVLQRRAAPSSPTTPGHDLAACFRVFDDNELSKIVELEESFPSAQCPVLDDYRGYAIRFAHGRIYAITNTTACDCPANLSENERHRLQSEGALFIASSLAAVKNQVDQHIFKLTQTKLGEFESLRGELHEARSHLASLERRSVEADHAIAQLDAKVERQRPWYRKLARFLRRSAGYDGK